MQVTVRVAIDVAEPSAELPTVLVVSEDPDWRRAAGRALERGGYAVLSARHMGHALVTCARHTGRLDVLLTDGPCGRRRTDIPRRILTDHPGIRLLHLKARPASSEELIAAVAGAARLTKGS